jgi:hypothetical protein
MTAQNTITLTPEEVTLVRIIASLKAGVSRSMHVPDAKRDPRDGFDLDLLGVAGELAFAKRFNLYPDLTFSPRSLGHDFLTAKGKTVDVKTTDRQDGRLLVTPKKKAEPSDVYFLICGDVPRFELKGYATAEQVFDDGNLVNLGRGDCYAVEQKDLKPI